jgi:hypothetical protein
MFDPFPHIYLDADGASSGSSGDGAGGQSDSSQGQGAAQGDAQGGAATGDQSDGQSDELNAARKQAAAADRARRTAETKARQLEEKAAEQSGEWKTLAETEKTRADAAEAGLAEATRRATRDRVAARLDFRNPGDANLAEGLSDLDPDDERGIERKLKALLDERPYLRREGTTGQRAGVGGDANGGGADMNSLIRRAAGRT